MAQASRDQNRVPTLLGVSSTGFLIPTTVAVNPSTHAMLVEASFAPSGTQDVNLTQVGGAAIALGQTTSSASLPVTIASNQTSFPVTIAAGSAVIGHVITDTGSTTAVTGNVTVIQGTGTNLHVVTDSGTITTVSTVTNLAQMNGAAISMGSGANGTGVQRITFATDQAALTTAGLFSVKVDQTTPGTTNAVSIAQIGANTVATAGVNGTLAVGGSVATNVAIGTNPINNGAQGVSSENSAVTTGRMVQLVADLVGKLIVLPYSNPENFVSGAITSAMTGTTSTSLIASPGGSLRNYITQITVSNAHATVGTDVIIQDGSGGTTLYTIPAAAVYGGAVVTFPTPLRQPTTATAIYCANVTTGASTKVSASGYKGL